MERIFWSNCLVNKVTLSHNLNGWSFDLPLRLPTGYCSPSWAVMSVIGLAIEVTNWLLYSFMTCDGYHWTCHWGYQLVTVLLHDMWWLSLDLPLRLPTCYCTPLWPFMSITGLAIEVTIWLLYSFMTYDGHHWTHYWGYQLVTVLLYDLWSASLDSPLRRPTGCCTPLWPLMGITGLTLPAGYCTP